MVYVLELEDGNYYVGYVDWSASKRIRRHFRGVGCKWTQAHPPVKVLAKYPAPPNEEYRLVLEYSELYGREKVRGAGRSQVVLRPRRVG